MWIKPGDRPLTTQTRTEAGCPFDCGLCPDHEQHSCLAIVEINEACNLACPVCFANATDMHGSHRPLAEIERMLDALVASEGEPDLVQISGGEPTIHPEFFAILDAVKRRPIRHVMINTNGVRIAQERGIRRRGWRAMRRGSKSICSSTSLNDEALMDLRGAELSRIRQQALEALERVGLSTTLVAVVKRGVNDGEIGDIVRHALDLEMRARRDLPAGAGRRPQRAFRRAGQPHPADPDPPRSRQVGRVRDGGHDPAAVQSRPDLDRLWLAAGDEVTPITRLIPRELILNGPNTISYEAYPELKAKIFDLLSLATAQANTEEKLAGLLCCLPQAMVPQELSYANSFRVVILQFLDRYNFDLAHGEAQLRPLRDRGGQIIPFDTYNTFYRQGAEGAGVLARHRASGGAARMKNCSVAYCWRWEFSSRARAGCVRCTCCSVPTCSGPAPEASAEHVALDPSVRRPSVRDRRRNRVRRSLFDPPGAPGTRANRRRRDEDIRVSGDAPFHAHIYYSAEERSAAAALREGFAAAPEILFVGGLTDRPVGPHPVAAV